MKIYRRCFCLAAVLAACLLAAACTNTQAGPEEEEASAAVAVLGYAQFPGADLTEGAISISALFLEEDGDAISGGAVRLSAGQISADFPLGDGGELRVSGLPRTGDVRLTLVSQDAQELGSMTISFAEGAVIDASTSEDGVGYVTTRADTSVVSLEFTVSGEGLLCALRLTE